jgi:hypothetical protein
VFFISNLFETAKDLYFEGYSLRSIEKKLGYPRKRLSRELKAENSFKDFNKHRSLEMKCHYTKPIHYDIVDNYISGATMKDLEAVYGISATTINRILYYHNVNTTNRAYRTYKLNETVFEEIDNEESAYWLGFLYADGYIRNDLSAVELSLTKRDEDHIIRFKKFLGTNSPIKDKKVTLSGKEYTASKITVCSKKLSSDLTSLGCFNNKSTTLSFPNFISKKYLHHFMRGYFDGDGSFQVYQSSQNHTPILSFGILGTLNFLEGYHNNLPFLNSYKSIEERQVIKHGKAYELRYSGNSVSRLFGEFIYKNSTVFLPRKYDKYAVVL